jgi:hypothetical protein
VFIICFQRPHGIAEPVWNWIYLVSKAYSFLLGMVVLMAISS